MAIILEEIYEVALHRYNMKLVAGGRGLRNLVDWVHTVEEMDYVSFLKGRELIITTGIREKDEETLVRFVKSLHETGASGLVINIGKYITSAPRGIIAYREEHGGFASIEEIMNVEGIKEGTFSKINDKISVG